ncbi:hypothetical protein R1flu_019249 [Riccia fluitans]|uniref:N-acetyltransferase ESCO2 n=1 Tax=Riccia fluitans TaxID=41844 RepID=A0ABD1ZI42_9MARC
MTLDPECSDEKFSSREFIDPSVTQRVEANEGLFTYKRRGRTTVSKREVLDGSASVQFSIKRDIEDVEEISSNSREDKASMVLAAPQKRRKLFDMWKLSRTASRHVSNMGTKKAVAPKVKQAAGQYFLDLGQKDFSYSTCPVCGMFYARGQEDDEAVHKIFHRNRTKGISFKGWQDERVVSKIGHKGDRVILVLPYDNHHRQKMKEVIDIVEAELGLTPGWLIQKACKVYLFISSSKKIVGCLMVEPIKTAYKLLPSKKQDVERVRQQVSYGQEKNSSATSSGESYACATTTSEGASDPPNSSVECSKVPSEKPLEGLTGFHSQKMAAVSEFSDMSVQAVIQNTAGTSSKLKDVDGISENPLACKAGEEISSWAVEEAAASNSRIRKITDFFEQRNIPLQVRKENEPVSFASPPQCSLPSDSKADKKKSLTASGCGGPRLSKISDYFVGPQSLSPSGGHESLQEVPTKVGLPSMPTSVERQEEKIPAPLMECMVKVEKLTGMPRQFQVTEAVEDKGKNNAPVSKLELENVTHHSVHEWKPYLGEDFEESKLEARCSAFRQEGFGTCIQPKLEVKEETEIEFRDSKDSREFWSRAAKFSGAKNGVQVSLKNEDMPKAELDDAQEYLEEQGGVSSVDASVQKRPLEPVNVGGNLLVFGNVKLIREVISRKRSRQEHDEELGNAIMYNSTPIPAICGVRVIWVSDSERGKGVASHLLDAMRTTFCLGVVLDPSQFAFSQPTTDGRKFAARYCKTDEFLVYTTS